MGEADGEEVGEEVGEVVSAGEPLVSAGGLLVGEAGFATAGVEGALVGDEVGGEVAGVVPEEPSKLGSNVQLPPTGWLMQSSLPVEGVPTSLPVDVVLVSQRLKWTCTILLNGILSASQQPSHPSV